MTLQIKASKLGNGILCDGRRSLAGRSRESPLPGARLRLRTPVGLYSARAEWAEIAAFVKLSRGLEILRCSLPHAVFTWLGQGSHGLQSRLGMVEPRAPAGVFIVVPPKLLMWNPCPLGLRAHDHSSYGLRELAPGNSRDQWSQLSLSLDPATRDVGPGPWNWKPGIAHPGTRQRRPD